MPTYDNQISWGTGFKFGQGVPVDDRFIFDDLTDADDYLSTHSFFIYEGLWSYLKDPGDYFYARRTDIGLPWDSITNPYIWIQYSTAVGGLPALGLPEQQLVMNILGTAPEYSYFNARGLFRFIGAAPVNPTITEGMYVRQTSGVIFEDVHTATNYPLNALSKLPLYFVFKIDGDDLIVGKFGIFKSVAHQLSQRIPLYLKTTYIIGGATYYVDLLTSSSSLVEGEYNLVVGNAIDSDNIFVDLTRDPQLIGDVSSGGSGNASIFRTRIQKYGVGGIPSDPGFGSDSTFTVPHGFGKITGIVQVVDLGLDGSLPGTQVGVSSILYDVGEVQVTIDYGIVDDASILEVVLIF